MRIGIPEILTVGSIVLLATGNSTVGWVFLGLAITGSVFRWGVEMQVTQQAAAAKQKEADDASQILAEAGKAFATLFQGAQEGASSSKSESTKDSRFH